MSVDPVHPDNPTPYRLCAYHDSHRHLEPWTLRACALPPDRVSVDRVHLSGVDGAVECARGRRQVGPQCDVEADGGGAVGELEQEPRLGFIRVLGSVRVC